MKLKFHHCLLASLLTLVGASDNLIAADSGFGTLRNPVWATKDNLRDPSVLKVSGGYHLFYSRLSASNSGWGGDFRHP
jgi:hypothetical protein